MKLLFKIFDGFNKMTQNLINKCSNFQKKLNNLENNILSKFTVNNKDLNKIIDEFSSLKKSLFLRENEFEKMKIKLNSDKSNSSDSNGKDKTTCKEDKKLIDYDEFSSSLTNLNEENLNNIDIFDMRIKSIHSDYNRC